MIVLFLKKQLRDFSFFIYFTAQSAENGDAIMDEPTVLRTTKIGGGFVKEDVLQYLDELNSKILSLQEECERAKKSGASNNDAQDMIKYRNQVENLQEKLNKANADLRSARKELETAKDTIAKLQAGKPVAVGSPAPANNAELDNAKKEIEALKAQLANAQANKPADNKDSAELARVKQDLARMTNELAVRAKAVAEKTQESANKDAKIAQLTKANADAIAKKDEEIAKKNAEIKELQEKANNPALMISDLFVQAQKTTEQLKKQAQEEADALKKEAQEKADALKKESQEQADKVISEAKSEAEKTVAGANTTAEKCIKDANIKAKTTIDEANKHADTVNEMSSTVRKILLNEIESINAKFSDISERLNEAKNVVGEARGSIDTNAEHDIKKMEAPQVDMSDVKSAVENMKTVAPEPKKKPEPTPQAKPVANNQVKPNNTAKPANNISRNATPTPAKPVAPPPVRPVQPRPQPKQQPKKPLFDMAGMDELLKSVEAEANNS